MLGLILGLSAVLTTNAPQSFPTPIPSDEVVFVETPSANDMTLYYPRKEFQVGITGSATLLCKATGEGFLTDSTVAAETPRGNRFGLAAKSKARHPQNCARNIITLKFSIGD